MALARECGISKLAAETYANLENRQPLTTLREFTMLHLMNSLTDKPGWEDKVGHLNFASHASIYVFHHSTFPPELALWKSNENKATQVELQYELPSW